MLYDPSFYLTLSFALFVLGFGRPIYRKFKDQLKNHRKEVESQIQEVNALYDEAQTILSEKRKELERLEEKIYLLKAESKKRVLHIQKEQKEALKHLEKLFKEELNQEKESLKNDISQSIQKDLLEKAHQNVRWILENKLTKSQKEKINTSLLENCDES
jgi:F0F1-type ATP synthase membrane subunit b/b'